MNGSGTPVSGARPSTVKTLRQRLAQDQRGEAGGQQLGVGARARLGDAQPGVGDHPVEEQQAEDAGHAELLADDGEDEVGVRLGQVEDLLDRLAEPAPKRPPEPSAIWPWTDWKPAPPACAHGSRNAVSRARR